MFIIIKNIINKNNYFKYIIYYIYISNCFYLEKKRIVCGWNYFFFFPIHLAYGNEVGGN